MSQELKDDRYTSFIVRTPRLTDRRGLTLSYEKSSLDYGTTEGQQPVIIPKEESSCSHPNGLAADVITTYYIGTEEVVSEVGPIDAWPTTNNLLHTISNN
jgi:hypothetical protein